MLEDDPRHNEAKRNYAVGYGKPPKNRQWKKGQSGNPGGKPREGGLADDLEQVMKGRMRISENGKQKTLSKRRALIEKLRYDAMTGSSSALRQLLRLIERIEAERRKAERSEAEQFTPENVLKKGGWYIVTCNVRLEEKPLYPIREAIQELQAYVRKNGPEAVPEVANALEKLLSYYRVYYPNWHPGTV